MALPRDFQTAYEALLALVERTSRGEVREEVIGEEVDTYLREGCRGAATLATAAALALRYKLASEGLEESPETVQGKVQALERVEAVLLPQGQAPGEKHTGTQQPQPVGPILGFVS